MAGDFSDDEWDISDDQLQVLEHNAIVSTQQPQNQKQNGSTTKNATARTTNTNSGSTLRLDTPLQAKAATTIRQQSVHPQRKEDSFDNPVLDEDGVPLVVEEQRYQNYALPVRTDETTQREQWRQNRHASKNVQPAYRPPARAIPHNAYQTYQQQNPQYGRAIQQNQAYPVSKTPTGTQLTPSSQSVALPITRPPDQPALRTELEKAKRDRELLEQKLKSITDELHTARGENAVIRGKVATDAKLAEKQLNAAKRQIQEQVTKHQKEIQSRDAAYTKLTTDHSFIKHELNEQAQKIQSLQRQVKEKTLQDGQNSVDFSPRKNLRNTLRDGFDDDEIMQLSPARSPAKRRTPKPATPSKKRKLPSNISDEQPLTLRFSQVKDNGADVEDGIQMFAENEQPPTNEQGNPTRKTVAKVIKDHQTEEHLNLIQSILVFRPSGFQDTLVECLVNFVFPSDPNRSLSSLLLFETSKLKGNRIPGDLLDIFTQLLSRCAKEEYYEPLGILLASIDLILDLEPTVIDAQAIQPLLQPLQTLATVNPRKRFHAEKKNGWDEDKPNPRLDEDVNTTACLDLLFIIASLVLDEPELIKLFWRCIETEFVLLMLTPFQTVPDLMLMLELLSTSIQTETFGNICNPEDQSRMETYIIDKVCFLLWDPPRHTVRSHPRRPYTSVPLTTAKSTRRSRNVRKHPDPPVEAAPSRLEICNLRLQVLSLLSSLLTAPTPHPHHHPNNPQVIHHGTKILVPHPNALVRLVRCLYDEVSLLSSNLPTHNLHAKLVNTTTTLIHHILLSPTATDAKGSFDLQRALSGTLVGAHKFRVVMTRIAFRDEKTIADLDRDGISEESARKATEVLEEYVTPDEAVQLVEVLGRGDVDANDVDDSHELENGRAEDKDDEAERAEADVMAGIER